jgi:hypothetical protein
LSVPSAGAWGRIEWSRSAGLLAAFTYAADRLIWGLTRFFMNNWAQSAPVQRLAPIDIMGRVGSCCRGLCTASMRAKRVGEEYQTCSCGVLHICEVPYSPVGCRSIGNWLLWLRTTVPLPHLTRRPCKDQQGGGLRSGGRELTIVMKYMCERFFLVWFSSRLLALSLSAEPCDASGKWPNLSMRTHGSLRCLFVRIELQ